MKGISPVLGIRALGLNGFEGGALVGITALLAVSALSKNGIDS